MPGMPRTPSAVEMGAARGSSLIGPNGPTRAPALLAMWYACQPPYVSTNSPGRKAASRDSTTSPTVPPTIGWPSSTEGAYDFTSFIRPRM